MLAGGGSVFLEAEQLLFAAFFSSLLPELLRVPLTGVSRSELS